MTAGQRVVVVLGSFLLSESTQWQLFLMKRAAALIDTTISVRQALKPERSHVVPIHVVRHDKEVS